jgi:YgiT-type zinc finger domain-containing protein
MEEKIIDQDFWINGKLVVIKNIPAGVCLQCGEKVVKANIGHFVANLIENPKIISKAPRISVPVLKFNF